MSKKILARGLAMAAILALPGALSAQNPNAEGLDPYEPGDARPPTVDIEGRAGVAVPVGDLTDFSEPGLAAGLGAAWWISDNVALRADGSLSRLMGLEAEAAGGATPNLNLFHYGMGLELDLTDYQNPWDMQVNVGGGGTTFDTEAFLAAGGEDDLTRTYPNVNGGVEIGRRVGENVNVSLSGQAFYTFLDEDEMTPLTDLRTAETLEQGIAIPVTLSVRWDLPRMSSLGN